MKRKLRLGRFTEKELAVIEKLSDTAKARFMSLNKANQKKLLKRAMEAGKREQQKDKKRKELRKKEGKIRQNGKNQRIQTGSGSRNQAVKNAGRPLNDYVVPALNQVLGDAQKEDPQREDGNQQNDAMPGKAMRMPFSISSMRITRRNPVRTAVPDRRQEEKEAIREKKRKDTCEAARKGVKTLSGGLRKKRKVVKAVKSLTNPVFWIAVMIMILIIAVVALAGAVMQEMGNSSNYQCQVSPMTEGYRILVSEYCEKYGISDYVDLCLAVMEQESGGRGTDVMQAEQSYHNTSPPIDTPEESIDCGVHEISDCLKKSRAKNPDDIAAVSLALQGYNYGNGYIEWALNHYKGYSLENARLFSQKMCSSLGLSGYGDPEYVPHVMRYYVAGEKTAVTNKEAAGLIRELKENNRASVEAWKMIEKGASLTGTVTYGMLDPPRQDDGRDRPTVLDCSSFVAWSFHKTGHTGIPFASTTKTFIESKRFETIKADELQPGDIGLKSATAPTGGANHVGIYCGKLKNGTKVWLHCTSKNGQSLTGNDSGVLMSPYTNFTYFRRLKKWN